MHLLVPIWGLCHLTARIKLAYHLHTLPPQAHIMIGTTISHYRILERLGAGGMGVVYKAQDVRLGRFVAVKFLPEDVANDPQLRERFQREARSASTLSHPNICTVYDIGEDNGRIFMAMEFLDGVTLKEFIRHGPLELETLIDIAIQVVDGLAAAHKRGIVHRDIKPANIMVTAEQRAKILDFGLAKVATPFHAKAIAGSEDETLVGGSGEYKTTAGTTLGTMPYMSPEQALGKPLDARTDLFSFGVTLYEMATGEMPFHGDTTGVLFLSIVQDTPVPPTRLNPALPAELQLVIDKCLEKDRELRYQEASHILSDLKQLGRASSWHTTRPTRAIEEAPVPAETKGSLAEASTSKVHATAGSAVSQRRSWKPWALLFVVVFALLIGGFLYWRSLKTARLTEKDSIVLADFTNTTGDAVFDGALRQGLEIQLGQSPFLSLVSSQLVQQTLRLMDEPPDARLTPEIAREVCQRTNSAAVLQGSIAQIGTRYSIFLKAVSCANGESLASAEAQASDKSQVLDALNKAASSMREKLGESLTTVKAVDTPVEQATTPCLEALHAYSLGVKTKDVTGDEAAVPLFEEAIRLDPNFAMAYALLGTSYSNLGERKRGAELLEKAYRLREHVSEPEKFFIDAYYHDLVLGDLPKSMQLYESWTQAYPRDVRPVGNLGLLYSYIGQHEKALDQAREALRLQPGSGLRYANLVQSYVHVGSLDKARATVSEARMKNVDSPYLCLYSYQLAFLQNDVATMTEEVRRAAGKPGFEDILLAAKADTAAYVGHVLEARELSGQAIDSAHRAGEDATAASYEAAAALREALFGNPAIARRQAAAALATSKERNVQFGAALALAFAGDVQQAQQISEQLSKEFPEDTVVNFNYLPTIRAQIALSRRDPERAIELLKVASTLELGLPGDAEFLPSLYPVYVRGNAYLAAGKGNDAAGEFEKILQWRGVVLNEPIGPLARLGLARAYRSQGEAPKARASYQDFLTLWKDADADTPAFKQAEAEYARVRTPN